MIIIVIVGSKHNFQRGIPIGNVTAVTDVWVWGYNPTDIKILTVQQCKVSEK